MISALSRQTMWHSIPFLPRQRRRAF